MFNHNDSIAQIHQALEHVQQTPDIFEVQSGGGLVQDIERAAGLALTQFAREFDALRFAARESSGRLSEMYVAEPHVEQRAQLGVDLRDVFENGDSVFHRGRQQIGDRKTLVLHLQRFTVVAAAMAYVAGDVDVREEIHLDALEPIALAGFAASALLVEAEAARFVAAFARFRQHGVEFADGREEAGVRGGVGARSAANGRLIDLYNLIDVFQAFDGIVLARRVVRSVNFFRQRTVKNVAGERRFAASGEAGDGDP